MALHGFALSKCARWSLLAAALAASPLHAAVSDFDNDGKSDIFWRNAITGQNYLYPMNGLNVLASEGYVRTVVGAEWQVAGVGDFNGDLRADTLWRNSATGENYIYLMNGKQVLAEGYIRTVPSQSWQVAGVGDFNADGRADILWRNGQTGENYLYMMNGLTITSEGYVRTIADLQWKVAGVGDFNEDGRADILWRHAITGQNYLYPMNGLLVGAGEAYLRSVGLDWQVAGLGDFDNDGMADVFWRNRITGENYLFPMNGALIKATEGYVRTVADQGWQVAAIGNYDGAGGADVFWRHARSGEGYMFFMSGTSVQSEGYSRVVAQVWRPVGGEFALQAGASPACASTGPSAGLAPALAASRTSGVAPLAVFFDASGTTGVTNAFHNVEYRWNFGDPGAGRWSRGARTGVNSRNEATGPLAAHVFEMPGTYKVCMTAFDGTRRAAQAVTITVQDPDAAFPGNKTVCFSNNSDFSGCPAGASHVTTSNHVSAIASMNSGALPRRLLFRRGHVFNAGSTAPGTGHAVINASGPGIVGAFGPTTSPPPRLRGTGSGGGILEISSSSTPDLSDWRVMDLEIDGTGTTSTSAHGISAEGGASRITMLRLRLHHMSIGINFNYQTALDGNNMSANFDGHSNWNQIAIVDSDIRQSFDNAGIYLTSQRFALLGSAVEDVQPQTTGHTTRFPSLNKAIISNTTLSHPTLGLQTIKLHSAPWPVISGSVTAGSSTLTVNVNADAYFGVPVTGPGIPAGTFVDGGSGSTITMTRAATSTTSGTYTLRGVLPDYTEQVIISDNKIIGSVDQTRAVNIMPQSASNRDERLRNIIVERNWFITGGGNSHALAIDADNVTVRNNICDTSASRWPVCISIMQERPNSLGTGANDVRIYNNTGFGNWAAGDGEFHMVELEDSVTNITVRNNLAHTVGYPSRAMISGTGGGGLVQSHNSPSLTTSPLFVGPLSGPAGFKPGLGSYAIGTGTAVPVWSDFFLTPQPAARDMGAVLH